MKQRIKEGIPAEQRVVIKITPEIESNAKVFTRIHSREFRYMGEMYDVLSFETIGDTVVYRCIHDVKESGLFKNLDNLVGYQFNHNSQEKEGRDYALTFFSQDYLVFDDFSLEILIPKLSQGYTSFNEPVCGFSEGLLRPPIC